MNEITYFLQDFIKSNFHERTSKDVFQIPNENNPFFQRIFKDLFDAEQSWENCCHEKRYLMKIIENTNNLTRGENYHFLLPDAKQIIENTPFWGRTYEYSIDSSHFYVHVLFFLNEIEELEMIDQTIRDEYFQKCFYKIYLSTFLANRYKLKRCSDQLDIYLYLTDFPKLYPIEKDSPMRKYKNHNLSNNKKEHIDEKNVNTGFTFACIPKGKRNEIYIFREEEWLKVLIHEMTHSFGLEFSTNNEIEQLAKEKIKPIYHFSRNKNQYNIFESYAEINAEIVHILMYYYTTTISISTLNPFRKGKREKSLSLKELFECEIWFSLFQCAKVLFHSKIDDLKMGGYTEKTNVFSYYILKSALMFSIVDLVEWYNVSNKQSLFFHRSKENIESYCDLIAKTKDNDIYKEHLECMKEWFSFHCSETLPYKTMRMTVLEF